MSDGLLDCIVVGLGGHGSATLFHLASRGLNVLGLEQFHPAHVQGSSHGNSRIFRQAYFEHPKYVPLLRRSFTLWNELSKTADDPEKLFHICGALMIGLPSSSVIKGTLLSIQEHNMPHQILSSDEVRTRYPMMHLDEDEIGIFEAEAGYLNPELCIDLHLKAAKHLGADIHYEEEMTSYSLNSDDSVTVTTSRGRYDARKLILTVGAWAHAVYGKDICIPLHLERRVLYWFKPVAHIEEFKRIPVYIWDLGHGDNFYGFPEQPGFHAGGVKVAFHQQEPASDRPVHPDQVSRQVQAAEDSPLRAVLRRKMPALDGELLSCVSCLYTLTPDEHFLIDFHPRSQAVILASPCSGHGFKFCAVVGEILADLAHQGSTAHDISLFRLARPALLE